jgi:hypothetical protein
VKYSADVLSSIDDDPFYFEVLVTHENAPVKTTFYKSHRLNAIELDMSHYFNEYDTISDDNIERFIKDNTRNHKWLSINPNGFIGELFYQHYLDLIHNVKAEHQALSEQGELLKRKNFELQDGNRRLSKREADLKANIKALENSDLIQQQRLALQEISVRESKLQDYYNNVIAVKERNINYKQEAISTRYGNLENEIRSRLHQGLREIEKSLNARKSQAEAEWLGEFEIKYQQATELANGNLAELEEKRVSVLFDIDDMSERLNSVDEREAAIALVKSEFRLAVIEYHSASKHIQRLTKELKPFARASGIPWPIDDYLIEELKQAGSSRVLYKLLKDR